jgi:hypothetical protein
MDPTTVRKHLEYAEEFLAQDEFEWIRESSLRSRAFYLGFHCALGPSPEDDAQGPVIAKFIGTLMARPGDDPFIGSKVQIKLKALLDHLEEAARSQEGERELASEAQQHLAELVQTVNEVCGMMEHRVQEIRAELLSRPLEGCDPADLLRVLRRHEESLRFICLGACRTEG